MLMEPRLFRNQSVGPPETQGRAVWTGGGSGMGVGWVMDGKASRDTMAQRYSV